MKYQIARKDHINKNAKAAATHTTTIIEGLRSLVFFAHAKMRRVLPM
jgi:hypothetical protein